MSVFHLPAFLKRPNPQRLVQEATFDVVCKKGTQVFDRLDETLILANISPVPSPLRHHSCVEMCAEIAAELGALGFKAQSVLGRVTNSRGKFLHVSVVVERGQDYFFYDPVLGLFNGVILEKTPHWTKNGEFSICHRSGQLLICSRSKSSKLVIDWNPGDPQRALNSRMIGRFNFAHYNYTTANCLNRAGKEQCALRVWYERKDMNFGGELSVFVRSEAGSLESHKFDLDQATVQGRTYCDVMRGVSLQLGYTYEDLHRKALKLLLNVPQIQKAKRQIQKEFAIESGAGSAE